VDNSEHPSWVNSPKEKEMTDEIPTPVESPPGVVASNILGITAEPRSLVIYKVGPFRVQATRSGMRLEYTGHVDAPQLPPLSTLKFVAGDTEIAVIIAEYSRREPNATNRTEPSISEVRGTTPTRSEGADNGASAGTRSGAEGTGQRGTPEGGTSGASGAEPSSGSRRGSPSPAGRETAWGGRFGPRRSTSYTG